MKKRIAIQGFEGSFHEEAVRQFFGKDIEPVCCSTFKEVVHIASDKKQSEGGVMAIENSIAGSILPNYNLLQKSTLRIVGEIYLQIRQNLMVNKGVRLEDIKEVHSHPMAIQQCFGFLDKHNWKLVETEDTALSAKHISQRRSKHAAAIASRLAAELFDMEIIAPNIHTLKNNYTRFLVLQPQEEADIIEQANKASLNFHTDNSRGILAKILAKIAEKGVDLSKLQSFPIPGSNWNYSFYVDMEFDKMDKFHKVIREIAPLTKGLKVYGIYKKGKTV